MPASVHRLPHPTVADVRAAAEACFAHAGYATALDVKLRLRARGFWATQDVVSPVLQAMAEAFGWDGCPCESYEVTVTYAGDRCRRTAERQGPYMAYWPVDAPPALVLGLYGEG